MTAPVFPLPSGPLQYPAGADRPIASMARFVLATIVARYDADPTAQPLPERQVITIGTVAVDAPVLAVMYGGVVVGSPAAQLTRPFRDNDPRTATFNVELWRSFPALDSAGNPPTAAQEQAVAEILMQDSWLLLESAYATDQMGVGVVASSAVNDPQGEMAGVSMHLELQVV
jgi:hypothetical protein